MEGRVVRLIAGLLLIISAARIAAAEDIEQLNRVLAGNVVDFTRGRFHDHRVWSDSLAISRDMYVYLPPGYDPQLAYPLVLWIHGFGGDEEQFTRQVVRSLDASIVSGVMPPVIAVAPDCSVPSRWKPWRQGSWCINGRQGAWEDYVVDDVLGFVTAQFKIRPERNARVIAGWSMGGFAAYKIGFKHPDKFRLLVGIYPNLHLRYSDRQGHWGTDFDQGNLGWLDASGLGWWHWLGRYPKPWRFPVNAGVVFWPAWGQGEEAIEHMSRENPYELVDRLNIQRDQFDMFVAYGGQDEYNVDAQVDAFLHKARERGLDVWVRYDPDGHHSSQYVKECMPDVLAAVGSRLRELLEPAQAVELIVPR